MDNAKIRFRIKQTAESENHQEEPDESSLFTMGEFRLHKGSYFIDYDETAATGYDGCHVQLHSTGDTLTMTRTGKAFSALVFEGGKRHFCHYGTEFGSCMVGITTTQLVTDLNDSGGRIFVKYTIDVNSGLVTTNELELTIEPLT